MNLTLNLDPAAIPDLTFASVQFANSETPWNLDILLYFGAAEVHSGKVRRLLTSGAIGSPIAERLELVRGFHEEINADLMEGGSRATAHDLIRFLRQLYAFADSQRVHPSRETVERIYCEWADYLYIRTLAKSNAQGSKAIAPLKMSAAYGYAATLGGLIDRVLERHSGIVELTKLSHGPKRKSPTSIQADKQNLEHTFIFGHMLQDVCDELTLENVRAAPLPIEITLRSGLRFLREEAPGIQPTERPDLHGRYHIANLRIEGELLMFIAQTGMNVSQAVATELRHYSYVSHLDGYQVKDYKARRSGIVLFEIFKDYRAHFERYLRWRHALFPKSIFLFPFISAKDTRQTKRFSNHRIRQVCLEIGIKYVAPRTLRNTRVNWLLRKSADPAITAEMAQHAQETLLGVYERPSMQRAAVETARFWSAADAQQGRTQSVAPGGCTGQPEVVPDALPGAPPPDCARASGCLWCENHRDVDSQDYVWALASYKRLKIVEVAKTSSPLVNQGIPPAQLSVGRINAKLGWYEQSSEVRAEWVAEAEARIEEGAYHPDFEVEILELEGRA